MDEMGACDLEWTWLSMDGIFTPLGIMVISSADSAANMVLKLETGGGGGLLSGGGLGLPNSSSMSL